MPQTTTLLWKMTSHIQAVHNTGPDLGFPSHRARCHTVRSGRTQGHGVTTGRAYEGKPASRPVLLSSYVRRSQFSEQSGGPRFKDRLSAWAAMSRELVVRSFAKYEISLEDNVLLNNSGGGDDNADSTIRGLIRFHHGRRP